MATGPWSGSNLKTTLTPADKMGGFQCQMIWGLLNREQMVICGLEKVTVKLKISHWLT